MAAPAAPAGGGEPPPLSNPPHPPLRPSFAAVTKGQPKPLHTAVQLAPRHYGTKDGKPTVHFTQSELQPGIQRLQHSLIAKFSAGRPRIDEVRRQLFQAWDLDTSVTIGAMDARHVLIILPNAPMANRILAHPIRKIGNYLFRIFRWAQDFKRNKEPTTTTSWIKLPGLPSELFDAGYLEAIVKPMGRFLAIDEGTRTCRNPSFARACVELDLQNPVPNEIWIVLGTSGGFWQAIEFENKLQYCKSCKLHGHLITNCRKRDGSANISGARGPSKDSDLLDLEVGRKNKEADQPDWVARGQGLPGVNIIAKDMSKDIPSIAPSITPSIAPSTSHAPQSKDKDKSLSLSTEEGEQEPTWMLVQNRKRNKKAFSKSKKHLSTSSSHLHSTPRLTNVKEKQRTNGPPTLDTPKLMEKQRTSGPSPPKASSALSKYPVDDGEVSCMPFAMTEVLDSEKSPTRYITASFAPSAQGPITTVVLKEKASDRITSSLNVRAAPFLPGHQSDIDESDEEWIPARKVKQLRKMEKQAEKDKLEDPAVQLNTTHPTTAVIADPAGTTSSETTPLSASNKGNKSSALVSQNNSPHQRNKDLPPLTYFRRTRVLDNVKINDDFALQSRRDNPYID